MVGSFRGVKIQDGDDKKEKSWLWLLEVYKALIIVVKAFRLALIHDTKEQNFVTFVQTIMVNFSKCQFLVFTRYFSNSCRYF